MKIKKQRCGIPLPASAEGFGSVKRKGKGFRPASENLAFFKRHVAARSVLIGDQRLSRLWIALETFPELRAAKEVWDGVLGEESPFRSQFLQEESFAADREYVLFITSSEEEFFLHTNKSGDFLESNIFEGFLRLDLRKFAKSVAQSFELSPKFAKLGMPKTSQVAELAGVPVVLTIQHHNDGFRRVAAELVSMIARSFILLAPTRKYIDANIEAVLSRCRAGFFDLESHLKISPAGQLLSRKSAKELFSSLLDQADHANGHETARASGLPKEHPTDKKNGLSRDKTTTPALLMGMGAGAGFLGVSRTTLWRMIQTGQLKKVEVVPGSYRVRRADLEAIAGAMERGN